MKKFISILMVFMLILCLAACGEEADKAITDGDDKTQTNGKTDSDKNEIPKDITLADVNKAKVSPESDFDVSDNGDGGVRITQYLGNDEIVVIPETIDGKTVTEIGAYVFSNDLHPNTKAIKLSDGIKTVGTSVCALNEVLEIFVSGAGLEEIGEGAFLGCTNLTTVVLNDGLKNLLGCCFGSCTKLKELELPASVAEIHPAAFLDAPKDFVIIGVAGSVAESFAKDESITFKAK